MAVRIMLRPRPVSRAVKQAVENAALLFSGIAGLLQGVDALPALGERETHFLQVVLVPEAKANDLTGAVFVQPAYRVARKRSAVQGEQDVALAHARLLGRASRLDLGGDGRRPCAAAHRQETKLRSRALGALQHQPGASQDLSTRKVVGAGNVAGKELLKAAPCNPLSGGANVGRIPVEAPLAGEAIVEVTQDIVEARTVVRRVADQDIKQHTEDLALVVIGDAEVRPAVERVFLEPGVEAGLLDTLPAARRPQLEVGYLPGEVVVELLAGPQARADKRVGGVAAGDTLGKPQRARPLLTGVVHRLERLRTNALDVPQVEELVRRHVFEIAYGVDEDCRGSGMLHPAAASSGSRTDVIEEHVLIKRSTAHQLDFVTDDPAQDLLDLRALPGVAVDHDTNRRSACPQAKFLEHAHFDGGVHKDVIVGGDVWPRPPARWHFLRMERHGDAPGGRQVIEDDARIVAAAGGHVEQHQGQIEESVAGVELRAERTGLVPIDGIAHGDRAAAANAPGLLVELQDGERPGGIIARVQAGQMVGEIAHLVERVPSRQLYDDFVLNLRDRHRYVKEMLLGPRHRDGVTNGGLRGCRGEESDEQQRETARSDHTAAKRHRLSSGDSARGRV